MEINHLIIRKAVPEDAQGIHGVLQESFKKYCDISGLDYNIDALRESVEEIRQDILTKNVLVAILEEAIIGTLRFKIYPDQTAYLTRFGVLPTFHRAGVGQSLMSKVDELMIQAGVKKVCLHTAAKNKDLVRFYYGRGFYVESTNTDRGYLRALMVKDY